jgi:hypothetical protein
MFRNVLNFQNIVKSLPSAAALSADPNARIDIEECAESFHLCLKNFIKLVQRFAMKGRLRELYLRLDYNKGY